jgi:capsule polysaccharide export protein KpsE/RkpR
MEGQLAALDVDNGHRQGDLVAPKGQVTQNGLDYARALRDMKYNETIYELLLRQYEVARVDEARQGSLVQVVDAAAVPDKPDSLYKIWIALAALVVALPLALLVAVCAELVKILRPNLRRTGSWVAVLEEAVTGAAL